MRIMYWVISSPPVQGPPIGPHLYDTRHLTRSTGRVERVCETSPECRSGRSTRTQGMPGAAGHPPIAPISMRVGTDSGALPPEEGQAIHDHPWQGPSRRTVDGPTTRLPPSRGGELLRVTPSPPCAR